jgi:hypothetical protein
MPDEAPREERDAVPLPAARRAGRRVGSGSRQMGQFWMNRLWRQNVGTRAH